jgi:SAM-dependent methyltransferase
MVQKSHFCRQSPNEMAADILGKALLDFQAGNYTEDIITHSSLDEDDVMPLPYLFRGFDDMPVLEQKALQLCKGSVLDIGCGAGSHSLYLQQNGLEVCALDRSPGAIETCRFRGVDHAIQADVFHYNEDQFDTLLLLMNGIGIAGRLDRLGGLLLQLRSLLRPNGQILLDSSNIIYMYDKDEDGGVWVPDGCSYYGEVTFTLTYKQEKSAPFWWLYVDFATLQHMGEANNLSCELVSQGDHFDYLARLTPI